MQMSSYPRNQHTLMVRLQTLSSFRLWLLKGRKGSLFLASVEFAYFTMLTSKVTVLSHFPWAYLVHEILIFYGINVCVCSCM